VNTTTAAGDVPDHTRRNVVLLALCHGLMGIGNTTMIVESALAGRMLAGDDWHATWPFGFMFLAVMLTTFPASMLMQRIGRRAGFSIGATIGIIGAITCAVAIIQQSFFWFCIGAFLTGVYGGFGTFYRFAAADGARPDWRGRAISYVLAGGVGAAILGPEIAKQTTELIPPHLFAGSFAALALIGILAFVLLQFIVIPPPARAAKGDETARPLIAIARQPRFMLAVAGGMIAYGSMNLVMTATPLAMVACGHSFSDSARVIQWHALGMFVPSFFTGQLMRALGVLRVMALGAVLIVICALVNAAGVSFGHFFVALLLLGIGWNFLFVGGSTLLTETYRPSERGKVQAFNDLMVSATVTATAFSSGKILHVLGWASVNHVTIPLAIVAGVAAVALLRSRNTAATP
jgi:MFS family permease